MAYLLQHGSAKLLDFPRVATFDHLLSLTGIAGLLELVGALLLIGLFVSPVACFAEEAKPPYRRRLGMGG